MGVYTAYMSVIGIYYVFFWLKKKNTSVGNVYDSKKCPEDFPRKR